MQAPWICHGHVTRLSYVVLEHFAGLISRYIGQHCDGDHLIRPLNLPFRTDFCLGGVHCLLSTNSHNVLRQAVPWQSSPSDSSAATLHMEIIEDSSLDSSNSKTTHFRGMRHLVFAMIEPGSLVTYDLLRREVRGVLSTAAARDASFWKASFSR